MHAEKLEAADAWDKPERRGEQLRFESDKLEVGRLLLVTYLVG